MTDRPGRLILPRFRLLVAFIAVVMPALVVGPVIPASAAAAPFSLIYVIGTDGAYAATAPLASASGIISGGGGHAAYIANYEDGSADLYWIDLDQGDIRLVDQAASDVSTPIAGVEISDDGRWLSYAAVVDPTAYRIRRWDATTGRSTSLSTASPNYFTQLVGMSDDGSAVVWKEDAVLVTWRNGSVSRRTECNARLLLGDGGPICNGGSNTSWVGISDDGSLVVENQSRPRIKATSSGAVLGEIPFGDFDVKAYSGDGRTLVGTHLQKLVPEDTDNARSMYYYNIDSDELRLVENPFRFATYVQDLSDDGTRGVVIDFTDQSMYLIEFMEPFPGVQTVEELARPQLTQQVTRLYRAYFLRGPDAAGLDFWKRRRASGSSLVEVSTAFAESSEFVNRYGGLTDSEFVTLVYRNVLDREPDAAGRRYWVGRLGADLSRPAMMVGFSDSSEFVRSTGTTAPARPMTARVWRLYKAYFLRPADQDGLNYWTAVEWFGTPIEDISGQFATSREFNQRYGSLGNAAFVDLVYRNVLGRPPEAGGRDFWLAQLAAGMTRGEMMLAFSDSPEYVRRTDTIPPR